MNGEPVTRDELQRVLADSLVRRQLEHEAGAEKTDSKALERLAVRKLISRHLLLQEAVRRGVTVSEQDVDKAVGDLRRRFDDLKEFAAWLTSRGLDDKSLFASVRTELLMTRVSAALVEDVGVTEEQVRQYYEGRKGNLKTAEGVRLRVIAAKDRAAADGILAALKTGASFEDLARTRSTFRPEQGGNIGWIGLQAVPPPVRAVIVTLKAGESGGPVQHGAGYLLVRLEERRPSRPATLAEARPEIRRRLVAAKRQQVLQAWLTEQEKKSHSEVINQ